jgi:predicted O-methyltransferase YrrM
MLAGGLSGDHGCRSGATEVSSKQAIRVPRAWSCGATASGGWPPTTTHRATASSDRNRICFHEEEPVLAQLVLDEEIRQYVLDVSLREDEIARELRTATLQVFEHIMAVPPEQGQLLGFLVGLTSATTVLEVGVFTGYSTLAMARALPPGGRLIACDFSEEWVDIGRPFWERAGVADRIQLELRPAVQTLDALLADGAAGTVDFAFIDADKESYPLYYERCLELLRPGGLMVIDNVLLAGDVARPQINEPETDALRALNAALRDDERVELSMLPVFDGVTLAYKR